MARAAGGLHTGRISRSPEKTESALQVIQLRPEDNSNGRSLKKKKKRLVVIFPLLLWRECWVCHCYQPDQGMTLASVLCRVLSWYSEDMGHGEWSVALLAQVNADFFPGPASPRAMFGLIGSHCWWEAQKRHYELSFPFPLARWHSSVPVPRPSLLKAHECVGLWCGLWGWAPLFRTSHPAWLWQDWWGTKLATRSQPGSISLVMLALPTHLCSTFESSGVKKIVLESLSEVPGICLQIE